MGFGRDLRAAVFEKVESFSQVEVNQFGPASLITRNTNDVQQVQTVVFMGLTVILSAPMMIIGGIILAVREDAQLSLLLLAILPLMGLVIGLTHATRDPTVPGDAAQGRPDQPGDARDPLGRACHPGVRAHRA